MKQLRKEISREGPEETKEIMLPAKISIPFFQSYNMVAHFCLQNISSGFLEKQAVREELKCYYSGKKFQLASQKDHRGFSPWIKVQEFRPL